jgi:hypothetical protein
VLDHSEPKKRWVWFKRGLVLAGIVVTFVTIVTDGTGFTAHDLLNIIQFLIGWE